MRRKNGRMFTTAVAFMERKLMRPITQIAILALFSFGLLTSAANAELTEGDAAPDFTLIAAQDGKEFTFALAEALKRGPVVLYFYPKSFTKTCTLEAHAFSDSIEDFEAAGASVIGVSSDGIEVQLEFSAKECRNKFPVGADPNLSVIKAYDAAIIRQATGATVAKRISYVISPERKVLSAFASSDAEKHIANTLAVVWKWSGEHKR